MTYISRNSSPVDAATYATADEAINALVRGADIVRTSETTFRWMGDTYTVESGENPKAARQAARVALLARGDMATAAQYRYLDSLSRGVPDSAYAHWVKPGMSKAEASRAISALQTIFVR